MFNVVKYVSVTKEGRKPERTCLEEDTKNVGSFIFTGNKRTCNSASIIVLKYYEIYIYINEQKIMFLRTCTSASIIVFIITKIKYINKQK